MLWLLAPLASAATVHVDSDAPVDVSVGTETKKVAAGGATEVSKLDGGTFSIVNVPSEPEITCRFNSSTTTVAPGTGSPLKELTKRPDSCVPACAAG